MRASVGYQFCGRQQIEQEAAVGAKSSINMCVSIYGAGSFCLFTCCSLLLQLSVVAGIRRRRQWSCALTNQFFGRPDMCTGADRTGTHTGAPWLEISAPNFGCTLRHFPTPACALLPPGECSWWTCYKSTENVSGTCCWKLERCGKYFLASLINFIQLLWLQNKNFLHLNDLIFINICWLGIDEK